MGMTQVSSSMSLLLGIDIVGIIIGIISLISVVGLSKKVGGKVGNAVNLLLAGIIFLILSFVWTSLNIIGFISFAFTDDVHHILMIIAATLLVIAARSLAQLMKPDAD